MKTSFFKGLGRIAGFLQNLVIKNGVFNDQILKEPRYMPKLLSEVLYTPVFFHFFCSDLDVTAIYAQTLFADHLMADSSNGKYAL